MIFGFGCKGAEPGGTELADKGRNFSTSARSLDSLGVETGTAELSTSQPSAHLSGHCREILLSWSSANDGEKPSWSFLKWAAEVEVWLHLARDSLEISTERDMHLSCATYPGSPWHLNTTEILLWESPLCLCDEKWEEPWWGWKLSKKTNLNKKSKWMKIKQVVCSQEDSMAEAAGKEGSTFPICTHTWQDADPSKT